MTNRQPPAPEWRECARCRGSNYAAANVCQWCGQPTTRPGMSVGEAVKGLLGLVILGAIVLWWADGQGYISLAALRTAAPTSQPTAAAVATPRASSAGSKAPRVTPTPRSTGSPRPTPAPTFDASLLVVSALDYSPTACWSTDWYDAQGHQTPGMEGRFDLTIRNPTKTDSPHVWFVIEQTRGPAINPGRTSDNWDDLGSWGDAGLLILAAPPVEAKGKRRYRWRVLFSTPFDAHYTLTVSLGPKPRDQPQVAAPEGAIARWDLWTANAIC